MPTYYCDDLTPYDGSSCPICIENFDDGQVVFVTECNHRMCQKCSTDFMRRVHGNAAPKCPVCRMDVHAMSAYTVVKYVQPGSADDPLTVGDSTETAIKVN